VRTIPWRALLAAAALCCGVAGCGGGSDYKNAPRPPAPINITAAITDKRVILSPTTFGAGPIVVTVSNQSGAAQTLTFETHELGGSSPGLRRSTASIAPQATGTLQVDVRKGTYQVKAASGGIRPATVEVGPPRKTAQQDLLQP
jgi:hypothetical protein